MSYKKLCHEIVKLFLTHLSPSKSRPYSNYRTSSRRNMFMLMYSGTSFCTNIKKRYSFSYFIENLALKLICIYTLTVPIFVHKTKIKQLMWLQMKEIVTSLVTSSTSKVSIHGKLCFSYRLNWQAQ